MTKTSAKNWTMIQKGWWVCESKGVGVCLERDGFWHSYISDDENLAIAPAFKTMKEAMKNAEKRVRK